ncbi:MAG: DUF2975 domain-containing protein [Chitinophagaceae bacterium]|nr:MAG: DUF2975 domain-containing protein [Chitinophagaceae bacterium]
MKRLIKYLKNYRKSTDILLLIFFIGNLVLLWGIVASSFNKDFVVRVVEQKSSFLDVKTAQYHIESRQVHSQLRFESDKFLDYVFVDKTTDSNLFLFLFTAFVFYQLMRIKTLWYHQYFTQKLYVNIDTLGYVAGVMFFFSRIQELYLNKLVGGMSNETLTVDHNSYLLIISVVIILLSSVLKSFAKQGNKLQEEQDLTI